MDVSISMAKTEKKKGKEQNEQLLPIKHQDCVQN